MSALHLRQIRWLNPLATSPFDRRADICVDNGRLQEGGTPGSEHSTIDASSLWLMPAMLDSCHHLPAPSASPQSDIDQELKAAWQNGFRAVLAAPDTRPCIDNPSVIEWIEQRSEPGAGQAQLHLLGALTQGLDGVQLSNMASLIAAGCVGLGQADRSLPQPDLLRQALRYAADLGICVHLQPQLTQQFAGCAHDGAVAGALGLAGIPAVSEALAVTSIIELVRDTGCQVHLSKLSTAVAVAHLRLAREQGLPITADVALWNLLLTDEAITHYDTRCHLNPPLRSASDRDALRAGVAEGVISAICSDHRALGFDDKFGPFEDTRAGANGVDGFLGALLSLSSQIDPLTLSSCTSAGAQTLITQYEDSSQTEDWLIVDPNARRRLQASDLHSPCQHSPWLGLDCPGAIVGRISAGQWQIQEHWRQQLGV